MKQIIMLLFLQITFICGQTNISRNRLIDSRLSFPNTESGNWGYWKYSHADFDGDGEIERVEILANMSNNKNKYDFSEEDFGWGTGNNWVVRFIENNGDTTWVVNMYVQSERIYGYLSKSDPPTVYLVFEGYNETITVYEVAYYKPDSIKIDLPVSSKYNGEFDLRNRRYYTDYWPTLDEANRD